MKTFAKRLTSTLLVLMLAVTSVPIAAEDTEDHIHSEDCTHDTITAAAEEAEGENTAESTPAVSGVIGESNVEWDLDPSTGRMVFTGSGDCEPFTSADDQPWAAVREKITEVWFYDMETLTISDLAYWFDGCSSLVTAEIPYTTPVIGTRAFADCPALQTVMLYYMEETFSIAESAFSVSEPAVLEVRYVTSSDTTLETLSAYDWHSDNRMAYYTDVYGIMTLATSTCFSCGKTCTYILDYEQWTSSQHAVRWWCTNCGNDMNQGTRAGAHKMSNGICTLCGYDDGSGDSGWDDDDDSSCTHSRIDIEWDGCYWEEYCRYCGLTVASGIEHLDPYTEWIGCRWFDYCSGCDELLDTGADHSDTYTEWEGCLWYEYCDGCDLLMDSGGSHGSTYREWSGCTWSDYCNNCDTLMKSGTSHGTYTYSAWENYSSSQHRRLYACSVCGVGSYEYGYHSTTTEYEPYSSTQHIVSTSCSVCPYSTGSGSYANHTFSYGSWSNYSSSQHYRSKICNGCGYSTYEYASHSLSYGSWTSTGSSQHRRTVSCSCGYSTTETKSHSLSYGSWTNYSSTQHLRTASCSTCRYSGYDYADHSLTGGSWTSISSAQHSRTGTCTCGYSGTETKSHSFSYGAWTSLSDSQHSRTVSCTCGYSSTEVDSHDLEYGTWISVSDSEHKRNVTCDCGYSKAEYGDHTDTDSDGYCDVCDHLTSRFSVTVPAYMTMVVSGDGNVYAATNAEIVNNSTAAVAVTDIEITTGNGWTLVPYTTEMADEKVDSRKIGFLLNGTDGYNGALHTDGRWTAAKDSSIPLEYDAVVSATSEVLKDEQVLTIVFVLDWAA